MSLTAAVQGLEAGGTISIRVSQLPKETPPSPSDHGVPHASLGQIMGDTSQGMGGCFTWTKAIKTAGGAPTPTTVTLASQLPKVIAMALGIGLLLSGLV